MNVSKIVEVVDEETPLMDGGTRGQRRNDHCILLAPVACLLVIAALIGFSTCVHPASTKSNTSFNPLILPSTIPHDTSSEQEARHIFPHVIELAQFKLVDGTSIETFQSYAKRLKPFFISTNDTIERSLVLDETTGEWSDIVYWSTMKAALQAAQDILQWPAAQPFLSCINDTTLRLSHSSIKLDWKQVPSHKRSDEGPLVEIAAFSIREDSEQFIKDATATTPFFQGIGTAKSRILSEELNGVVWYDFVYWSSVKAAVSAANAIQEVAEAQPFLKAIDDASDDFEFTYSSVILRQEFE